MVVALLPLIKERATRDRELLLPVHFTAASMWVESLRLLPNLPREGRIAFCNGLGVGFMVFAHAGTLIGYLSRRLAAVAVERRLAVPDADDLPGSTASSARFLSDRLALGFGLVVGPLLGWGTSAST